MRLRTVLRSVAILFGASTVGLGVLHCWVVGRAELVPPPVPIPKAVLRQFGDVQALGDSFVLSRGRLREVHLRGSPEAIGYAHARLLRHEMLKNEGILYAELEQQVPVAALRRVLLDVAQWRYYAVDQGFDISRRREIAAQALAFQPDPYRSFFETYQRFIYLNALYDISLSFENSPLIGCTSFVFSGARSENGHALLARAFDFEVNDVFDEDKAVFFVQEDGKIPFASVAWPGLIGVVSGMNTEGLAVVVHGGRAGEPRATGEPVVHALRRVLSECKSSKAAVAALAEREPMVSHIIVVTDAKGDSRVVERVPGRRQYDARLPLAAVVTNHFAGPSADDPRDLRVREQTSTLARKRSGQRLLDAQTGSATIQSAVAMLRDRQAPDGSKLELGDRDAIDALIATHGVVMDATQRVLWVSESPHLLGRFVAFDLRRHMDSTRLSPVPASAVLPAIDQDPLLSGGEYFRWRAASEAKR